MLGCSRLVIESTCRVIVLPLVIEDEVVRLKVMTCPEPEQLLLVSVAGLVVTVQLGKAGTTMPAGKVRSKEELLLRA